MFRLNVLNAGGRDPEQHFNEGAPQDATAHAPVNFHAYAACTGGSFFRDPKRAVLAKNPVLLLLRGDFRDSERALNFLKKAGVPVAVSLKETGLHQIANQLSDPTRLSRFLRVIAHADGCIAPTLEAAELYRTIRKDDQVVFIATPYPLHDTRWNFSRPNEQRRGILLGTREWDVPSRNHLAALFAARQIGETTGEPVTVYNFDGRKGEKLISEIGQMRVLKRGNTYADYLRVVAEHKIVFQLDRSSVPGQVAGDALLSRVLCLGGNGAIDGIAFPEFSGAARSIDELIALSVMLLRDAKAYENAIADSQRRANEQLSFSRVSEQLENFYSAIASK